MIFFDQNLEGKWKSLMFRNQNPQSTQRRNNEKFEVCSVCKKREKDSMTRVIVK